MPDTWDLRLSDFAPRSRLVVPETVVDTPAFPVVDSHSHLGGESGDGWGDRPVEELIDVMDESDVEMIVDLDGGWGETTLYRNIDRFQAVHPDRFRHFGGVDWSAWQERGDGFAEWAAGRLEIQASRGASGFKIWKQFGLNVFDGNGRRAVVDDRNLDPIWEMAGSLDLPIVIHVADPVAFFDPLDEANERWDELHAHPDWHFPSPPYPPFLSIVEGLATIVQRHPNTTFIGAHVGCYAENLAWVGALMDRTPNFYVDIAARISELGRQPRAARQFFINHADRILFGTDTPPNVSEYRLHYRFLETEDEYFDYSPDGRGEQGRWRISALSLPSEVLAQVYTTNARLLVP